MLKLREGWKTWETDCSIYFYPPWTSPKFGPFWYVYMDLNAKIVYAYPNGGNDSFKCKSTEEAHAYLLSVGSKSPWEEV
jgi:hypothetical protein